MFLATQSYQNQTVSCYIFASYYWIFKVHKHLYSSKSVRGGKNQGGRNSSKGANNQGGRSSSKVAKSRNNQKSFSKSVNSGKSG